MCVVGSNGGGFLAGKKGWWGEGLGRSTAPREWCTLSRWTARNAISLLLSNQWDWLRIMKDAQKGT